MLLKKIKIKIGTRVGGAKRVGRAESISSKCALHGLKRSEHCGTRWEKRQEMRRNRRRHPKEQDKGWVPSQTGEGKTQQCHGPRLAVR